MIRDYISSALQNKNSVMFITAITFILGIIAYFNNCAILFSALISIAASFGIIKKHVSVKLIIFWIFMFYFGFFLSIFKIQTSDDLLPLAPTDAEITGQIVSIPNSNVSDKTKFFFKVNNINGEEIKGKTIVTAYDENGDFSKFNIGNTYKLKGKLRTPFKASNPSQFDYGKYLRNYNTFTVFYTKAADDELVKTKLTPRWQFMQGLNNVRDRIIDTHSMYMKSPNLEILGGVVFGDDAIAPPDYIKASFANSGLLHILAASGMNVAFISGFLLLFLKLFRVPYKIRLISSMGIIILYTLMTGLGPSVVRAALMLIFIQMGKLIDRDAHSVSLLSLVAMLMLIYNPAFINDVGFQLSFVVVFGLFTTANAIAAKLSENKFIKFLQEMVLIPVVAQIWVAPIQMFYFSTFSTYSVFANVAIMPFLSVISFAGFISSVLAIFTPIAKYVCFATDFVLNYFLDILVAISNFFGQMPHSLIQTTHPSIYQLLMFYSIILIFTIMLKDKFNKKSFVIIGLIAIAIGLSTITVSNRELEITAFDVQNADAFLIKTPQDKYFIIDTGKSGYKGGNSQAKVIIIKYLKDRGIKNIEGVIVTHFDNDHSGGAADILKELNVKNIYLNSFDEKNYTAIKIYKTIKDTKVKSHYALNNKEIYSENGLKLKTFRPHKDNENENSIITLLSYNGFDMLFMGDAGIEGFNQVKKDIPKNIEVLKVGHHGGNHVVDTKMLEHLNNEVSLISTGVNNFGHPTRGTLDTLRNTKIYRTDRNNSIRISSIGRYYKIMTFDKHKKKYILSKRLRIRSTQ